MILMMLLVMMMVVIVLSNLPAACLIGARLQILNKGASCVDPVQDFSCFVRGRLVDAAVRRSESLVAGDVELGPLLVDRRAPSSIPTLTMAWQNLA